ncbi:oligopeptide transport system substrate-binding protein [Entomoplasma freundtii]|uniref:Oligopeptide ABC transporter substrate-binding protein n=1 Tax=Entomoplasma freundtii TaxID=74700 RepID=A0A2K8NTQ3_9MOLU|nr:oligopeptide ABC transporter substrate-binding protein OppA [Entomoplasma freundtii]ATZ16558.1 oligopeptide ABC transporter substrate-binding protein [Entomoplasma freundtii]TDY58276.1 oligopeptide transport system substrate-binding protein [Entomoplasma freundtii]
MKKYLSGLLALALITTAASSVVSCGPITFTKLLARKVDPQVYRGAYKMPMTTWSSASTMQNTDSMILTNLQDSLLATDHYNNFEGALADAWEHKDNMTSWSFHIRQGKNAAYWTRLEGKNQIKEKAIKPSDFFNTFRFIFNPNNASQAGGVWQQIIYNGGQLVTFIENIRDKDNDLYDVRFTKRDTKENTVLTNNYIDRAILAFNLYPDDPKAARDLALNGLSTFDENGVDSLAKKSFNEGKIISGSDESSEGFNLHYHLLKPAPYFESMAAFLSFAPLPDVAINYGSTTKSGISYGLPIGKTMGYQNIWYSGAYVVNTYNPTQNIELVKSQNYYNKANVKIEKLKYSYVGNVSTSRQRFFFESGDLSEVAISSNDAYGWKKYVGDNYDKPRFSGLNKVSRPQANTYGLFFNYGATKSKFPDGQDELDRRNKALAQRSVRNLIRFSLNRSEVSSFYSRAMDGGSRTSHNLRNTWTSKNVATDKEGKDYARYLQDEFLQVDKDNKIVGNNQIGWLIDTLIQNDIPISDDQINQWSNSFGVQKDDSHPLDDGRDPYFNNDLLGLLSFIDGDRFTTKEGTVAPIKSPERVSKYVNLIGNYSESANNAKFKLLKEQARDDLKEVGVTGKVQLPWLINGANSTGINNYIKNAIHSFEDIGGNDLIQIVPRETTDASDFVQQQQSGEYSMVITGWVPDYSDPFGFLHTLFMDGDLNAQTGLKSKNFPSNTNQEPGDNQAIDNTSKAFDDLLNRVSLFMDESNKIDLHQAEQKPRYEGFAKVENYAIMESILMLPLQIEFLDDVAFLSYVNPFSRSTFSSGQALYRFIGVEMTSQLWDQTTFKAKRSEWENGKKAYKAMYPDANGEYKTVIDGDWQASK